MGGADACACEGDLDRDLDLDHDLVSSCCCCSAASSAADAARDDLLGTGRPTLTVSFFLAGILTFSLMYNML